MIGEGSRDEGNTQNTSDYDTKIDLDIVNIDKNDKDTQRTIYEAICERYFGEVILIPRSFIIFFK